jgi:hypothetical protein
MKVALAEHSSRPLENRAHSVVSRLRTCQSKLCPLCERRSAPDVAIIRRRVRPVEDTTVPTRDVLVAPRFCASSSLPD